MAGAVGCPGDVTGLDGALDAVVIVFAFAGEDEVAFAVAVMLVVAKDITWGQRHTREEAALVFHFLWAEDVFELHAADAAAGIFVVSDFHVWFLLKTFFIIPNVPLVLDCYDCAELRLRSITIAQYIVVWCAVQCLATFRATVLRI